MVLKDISSQSFLIMGLARSGFAVLAWLLKHRPQVYVYDTNQEYLEKAMALGASPLPPEIEKWPPLNMIIKSPGIPLSHPYCQHAMRLNTPILSDVDLFRKVYPQVVCIGITGTNGKSTTTALVGHILKETGHKVHVAGNIGVPVFSLPALDNDTICVLELSSFQLETAQGLNLNYVGWTNLTPDHLDRHDNMPLYCETKKKIFQTCGSAPFPQTVITIDDEWSRNLYEEMSKNADAPPPMWISHQDQPLPTPGIRIQEDGRLYEENILLMDLSQIKTLKGSHNYQNAAIAWGICQQVGLSAQNIARSIKTFPGLAHRQEIVGEIKGIQIINDSKATNGEAAVQALKSFEYIYWILGGVPKSDGLDLTIPYWNRVKHAFLIGQAQNTFARSLEGHVSYTPCHTLENALEEALKKALKNKGRNSTILLSPACASYDQFKDFEQRGDIFRELVKKNLELY